MQGLRILRNEAYLQYAAMTKDEAKRSSWTFYEAVKFICFHKGLFNFVNLRSQIHPLPSQITGPTI